jgi:hypothetical protein
MIEMKKLTFPVDLSTVSSRIASSVIALGEKFGAEIHLVHVVETLEDIAGVYGPALVWSDFEEEVVKGAERELERFEQKFLKDYPKTKRVVLLFPVEKRKATNALFPVFRPEQAFVAQF